MTKKRSKQGNHVKEDKIKTPEDDFITQNRALRKIIKALDPEKSKTLNSTNNPKK